MRQLGAACVMVGLAGCSLTPPEEDPVQLKLRDLEARIVRIERVVSNQSLLDLAQRLDGVQGEIRALHGQVEELQNGSEALSKQQRDLYSDLDKRLSSASAGVGAAPVAGTPGGVASGGEQAAYAQAFDAIKSANYPAAIAGFQQFLADYPGSELTDNAQYWLGEAYYVTRDYQKAAGAFRSVSPQSRKASDALLKLGYSQFELKQFAEARTTLTEVQQRFPDSDAARLAAERLQRLPAGTR
jgi:tol-pal system protein YbgF